MAYGSPLNRLRGVRKGLGEERAWGEPVMRGDSCPYALPDRREIAGLESAVVR